MLDKQQATEILTHITRKTGAPEIQHAIHTITGYVVPPEFAREFRDAAAATTAGMVAADAERGLVALVVVEPGFLVQRGFGIARYGADGVYAKFEPLPVAALPLLPPAIRVAVEPRKTGLAAPPVRHVNLYGFSRLTPRAARHAVAVAGYEGTAPLVWWNGGADGEGYGYRVYSGGSTRKVYPADLCTWWRRR